MSGSNPQGLCKCGCGERTRLAPQTVTSRGWVANQPIDYVKGHWSRVQPVADDYTVDAETGCWNWAKAKNSLGYGAKRHRGKTVRAHRYVYEQIKGPIPSGLVLDHLCRNTSCVNPDHLEAVTSAENSRRGNAAKLSMEIAARIRESAMSPKEAAQAFGVAPCTISNIRSGKRWI